MGIWGFGLKVVENVEEAEFVLAHGTEALGRSSCASRPMKVEDLEKILEKCTARKIPTVVANPDFVTVEARALRVMPGTLAATYEKLGGEVKWMGKPDKVSDSMATINGGKVECGVRGGDGSGPTGDEWWTVVFLLIMVDLSRIIYKSAMEMAGVEEASECIAAGDSLHHDIKGANVAGIQSAFITGGIHSNELGLSKFGQALVDPSSLHGLTSKFDAYPSYVLPSFTWFSLQEIASKNDSVAEKLSQP
ncbi:hypothetical protein LguiA_017769 [Lonicera macranthoides]